MKILVVNGSPKGDFSITVQTVKYIEKKFPGHSFEYLNAGQKIKQLEKDFSSAKTALENCDMVLFSYPVYTFIAPSQLHYFIRLIKENNVNLEGKCASQITTSKHFYDTTAHNFVKENCFDLNMKFIEGLSADMDDLLKEKGQKEAVDFFKFVLFEIENNIFVKPVEKPSVSPVDYSYSGKASTQKSNKEIVVIKDSSNTDDSLENMVRNFVDIVPYKVKVIDLFKFPFKGGCLGCFNCASSGKCIYKDNFDSFLREEIQTASSIVFAFKILDHSMGPRFKMYDDRQFCNGHRTVTSGMPMGYIVSGNLDSEENLRTIINGRGMVGGNFISYIATNQKNPAEEIKNLSKNLEYSIENKKLSGTNFLGVGGMKIFRDLIYLMQGLMKEDHRFYKSHGLYLDFPQNQKSTIFKMKLVGLLMNNKKLMSKAGNKVNEGMIGPYKKVLEEPKRKEEK